jgi:hypothetical protein
MSVKKNKKTETGYIFMYFIETNIAVADYIKKTAFHLHATKVAI